MQKMFREKQLFITPFKRIGKILRSSISLVNDLTQSFLFRLETVKLLLNNGADPFKESKYGDDTLQTACLKGSLMIFNYLLEHVKYTPERIADAFELIGSSFLLDLHDLGSTLFFWRKGLEIRYRNLSWVLRIRI